MLLPVVGLPIPLPKLWTWRYLYARTSTLLRSYAPTLNVFHCTRLKCVQSCNAKRVDGGASRLQPTTIGEEWTCVRQSAQCHKQTRHYCSVLSNPARAVIFFLGPSWMPLSITRGFPVPTACNSPQHNNKELSAVMRM